MLGNIYIQLALVFAKLGLLSIGGTPAVLAQMGREVAARGWMGRDEFVRDYALSQVVPGPAGLAPALLGSDVAGPVGGLVAWLAFSLPTLLLALLAACWWGRIRQRPWPAAAKAALTPIVIGLSATALLTLMGPVAADWRADLLALAAFGLVERSRLPVALVPLSAAVVGAMLFAVPV